jgi:hypothetical protein
LSFVEENGQHKHKDGDSVYDIEMLYDHQNGNNDNDNNNENNTFPLSTKQKFKNYFQMFRTNTRFFFLNSKYSHFRLLISIINATSLGIEYHGEVSAQIISIINFF